MPRFLRARHLVPGIFAAFVTPAICVGLTSLFGDMCWPQRVGAVYVGSAVFLQGYLVADEQRFSRQFQDGTKLRDHINAYCFFAAILGTFFAAFGDVLPPSFYYGSLLCKA